MLLHIGATTPAGVGVTVAIIFLLIFAMSFAFGSVPEGGRRFSGEWTRNWLRASIPRMVIAGVFAGAVLVGALAYGGNSGTQASLSCGRPVPPITGTAVTDDRVLLAISSLEGMADAANRGDVTKVQTIWVTADAHNLTHDIDGPLRNVAPDLAKSLCENVVALENVMVGQIVAERVAADARAISGLLQEARPLLRSESGAPSPIAGAPCERPVGAVSNQPLTAQRLQSAIGQLNNASSLAASGNQAGAEAAFSGDAHNVTHDIDGPLRTADEQLAIDLCLAVVDIESHIGAKYDGGVMESQAAAVAGYIDQAGREMGIIQ